MLPISAFVLVSLLLMSALVLDVGRMSLERRRDQTAVDTAIIAGAMNRSSQNDLTTTIVDSFNKNLNTTFTVADLDTCGTDTVPPDWTPYPGANCLSRDPSWTQLRLRVPTQSFETSFATLAGVTEMEHTAVAQIHDRQRGVVLPFALSASAGDYECLKVGAGNVPDPDCSGSTSGNFGVATFGLWGNEQMGTATDCTGTGDQFMINVAQGLDHDLSRWGELPHNTVDVIDMDSCGSTPRPNSMTTTTGNTPQKLGLALFGGDTFPDGGPSRLQRTGGMPWFSTTWVAGATLDDTPLWEYIDPTLSASDDAPASCFEDQFGPLSAVEPEVVRNHLALSPVADQKIKLMERCFAHFQGQSWDDEGALSPADVPDGCMGACTTPIFSLDSEQEEQDIIDLQASARFGYVPQINSALPSGNGLVRIAKFRAVYLQRVYGGNCSSGGCPLTFDPGFGYTFTGTTDKASALTAFIFPAGILPNGLADDNALELYGSNRFVELTR